jgi:hypothetical protein
VYTNPIIQVKDVASILAFKANYPGHVDLTIAKEFRHNDDFIVMTAEAAAELNAQLTSAIETARNMAEQEPLPIIKEAE